MPARHQTSVTWATEPGDAVTEPASTPDYGPGEERRPRECEPTASAHGELL
ncbi:MAG: hypothetical protein ACXW4T_07450 [Candidatus Limnocylindrales bacterium]